MRVDHARTRTHTCGQLDEIKRKREERIREDIRVNGSKWVPEINRHFMDADNSTSNFGPCLSLVTYMQLHTCMHAYIHIGARWTIQRSA